MRALVLLFLSISVPGVVQASGLPWSGTQAGGLHYTVHAAEVRFFTEHAKLSASSTGAVFIENTGDDTINDVRIEITIADTLDFAIPVSAVGEGWDCATAGRRAICTISRFRPRDFAGIFFEARPRGSRGGHHAVTATFSARNHSGVAPVVFDLVSSSSFAVTAPGDFGAGTLRAAIEAVNDDPLCGTDVPCFIGISPMTIAPATPLPPIRKCNVFLSGPDDLEFPRATKEVVISGENARFGNGLEVRASCAADVPGVTINSVVMSSWPWNGIYFEAPAAHATNSGHTVNRSYIGTDATGTLPRPNGSRGIVTDSPHEVLSIFSSIVAANGRSGIALFRGKQVQIGSSRIRDNGASGVFTNGVPLILTSSTIADNSHAGVSIARGTPVASVSFNDFGPNGGLPIDWALDGRTPRNDESDGIPNAPRVVDAFYDGTGRTIVRGSVRLHGTGVVTIEVYQQNGNVLARVPTNPQVVSGEGEVAFEIALNGDPRGRAIALQAHAGVAGRAPHLSSEISEAVPVR